MSSLAADEVPIPLAPAQLRGLLLGLALATGMEFFTFDAMNLVLVDLAGTLGVSFDEASWLLTIYSSTLFLGVPVCIWLAGHVGYKRYLLATIFMFCLASMGCMAATDLQTMLLCRAVQGFAGAGLVVWWRATIYIVLPRAQRSAAMMQVSTMLYLWSAAGLLLGGTLTDHFSWRLIFLPSLLCSSLSLGLIARYFPRVPAPVGTRVLATDWQGIALIAVSLISLQIVLNRGHIDDWLEAPRIRLLCWLALSAFVAFVGWQLSTRNRSPLLWLDLLKDRRVLAAASIGVVTGMILSGSLYVLPEYLRQVASPHLSAEQTGAVMAVYALSAAAMRPGMLWLIARIGQRKAVVGATTALVISMLIFSRLLTLETPRYYYALPLFLYACCLCALLPAVGSGTVARIEQNKLLDGVSLYMTFRQFGASLGVALLTILVDRRESLHSSRLFEHLHNAGAQTMLWLERASIASSARAGLSPHDSALAATELLKDVGARQAATLANADAFLFMACVGVLGLCLVPLIPPTGARK